MNVLYLLNYAGSGGTEKYVYDLATHLTQGIIGGQAFFIYHETGRLCGEMAKAGIEPIQVTMRGAWDIKAALTVASYCEQNNITIIHTHFLRETYIALTAGLILSLRHRPPPPKVVYTCHINMRNNGVWKALNRWYGQRINAIIAVCHEGKRLMTENRLPSPKITVIHNGVETRSGHEPDDAVVDAVRAELGITGNVFVFITLTRFTPEKGTAFLLEGVKRLKELTDKPFRVLIAGEGPERDILINAAKTYEISHEAVFLGYRTDTERLLQMSDVYLNTSSSECLSLAILEAMNQGLPVIATDIGGNPDVVNNETNCGVLVPYGDAEALARAMLRLMNDASYAKACSRGSRRAVKERFSSERSRADTFAVYKRLMD